MLEAREARAPPAGARARPPPRGRAGAQAARAFSSSKHFTASGIDKRLQRDASAPTRSSQAALPQRGARRQQQQAASKAQMAKQQQEIAKAAAPLVNKQLQPLAKETPPVYFFFIFS